MVVQDIQEVAQYLELKFKVNLQWKDARVLFYNIKKDEMMNSLSLDEQLILWTPTIVFWNTKNQLRSLNDENTFGSIRRDANGSIIEKEDRIPDSIEFETKTLLLLPHVQLVGLPLLKPAHFD